MLHTVMVPLDGTVLAEQALPLATSIAQRAHACLVLVRVVPPPVEPLAVEGAPLFVDQPVGWQTLDAQQYLHAVRRRLWLGVNSTLPLGHRGLDIHTHSLVGEPAAALAAYAETSHADLIVMATHGAQGLRRWVFGSVADQLLAISHCPVIAVHPAASDTAPFSPLSALERILIPLDGSPLAETVLPLASELAQLFNAECLLLRATTARPEPAAVPSPIGPETPIGVMIDQGAPAYLEETARMLNAEGCQVRTILTEDHAVEAILKTAQAQAVDLIAMTSHGRSGLSRAVYGSVTDRVLRNGHCPVLIVRPKTDEEAFDEDIVE
jgi:nucleotide-binding universal stress UspA family protein